MALTEIPIELSSTPSIVDGGNATAITIDSSENVGIGTSSPAGKLDVSVASNQRIRFDNFGGTSRISSRNDSAAIVPLFIDASDLILNSGSGGNVGIGTTSPAAKVNIDTAVAGDGGASSATRTLLLAQTSGTQATAGTLKIDGVIHPSVYRINIDSSTGAGAAAPLSFSTANGATETMRIDSSGQVGIGNISPAHTLEIHNSVAGDYTDFGLRGTGHKYVIGVGNDAVATVNDKWYLYDNDNSAFRMVVDTAGSLLINSTATADTGGIKLFSNSGVNAAPATSGTTQTGGALRLRGANNAVLDMGLNSVYTWIQATDKANLALEYSLALNPNGGNVGIGVIQPAAPLHLASGAANVAMRTQVGYATDQTDRGAFTWHDGSSITGQISTSYDGTTVDMNFGHLYSSAYKTTRRLVIKGNGGVGTNVANSSVRTDIAFTSGSSNSAVRWGFGAGITGNNSTYYVINQSNVGVYMSSGGQAWVAHSDERIKENIVSVGTVLPTLMNMRCVKYNLKSNPTDTKIGFIAQDWESNFPEVVDEEGHLVLQADGTISTNDDSDSTTPVKAMAYTETIPLLLKAIQELKEELNTATARITELENN